MITLSNSFTATSSIEHQVSSIRQRGFVLPLVLMAMVILMALIMGAAMTSYGSRLQAVQTKAQTEAMLAAEAGYEQAIFWMSQRTDLLGDIEDGNGVGSINFETGRCDYEIGFHGFIGARPVFRVTSTGICGRPSFTRVVDVDVMQETSGWAMGACRIPSGASSTTPVYFGNGEVIDMPLHINKANDAPSDADIFISTSGGNPTFLRKVAMGESRKNGSTDKRILDSSGNQIGTYGSVMSLFKSGIDFEQPGIRITDDAAVQSKINRFRDSTADDYIFEPNGVANITVGTYSNSDTARLSAVQLEFYIDGTVGKVRITDNCTVLGYRRNLDAKTNDFATVPYSGGNSFQRYYTYAYHFAPDYNTYPPTVATLNESSPIYVSQPIGEYHSEKGGQIYVNGNVVIGGCSTTAPNQVVKGKITVVATGNIWVADSIVVDGTHDVNGMPTENNPNVLGLIAQGVIKVVDPGMSKKGSTGTPNNYPADASFASVGTKIGSAPVDNAKKHYYIPIGIGASATTNDRYLPDPTVVEAAITVGGGGWGAENVLRVYSSKTYGDRKVYNTGHQDYLIVRGSITEVVRGVVGHLNSDGYVKRYYIDTRLMSGILPGDIWFSGKYIPAPAGWSDHGLNH
jgi:hypothetical protein